MPFRFLQAFSHCLSGLVMLAPDDGGGTGAAGAPPAPTDAAGTGGQASGAGDPAGPASQPASLTAEQQAAVDAEVARQLASAVAPKITAAEKKARSQWEADLKALADAETQTAEQKAQAEAEQARHAAAAAIETANRTLRSAAAQVALTGANVPAERVAVALASLDLSDVEVTDGTVNTDQLNAAVTGFVKANQWLVANNGTPPPAGTSGGDMGGKPADTKPKTLADAVAKHYA